MTPTNLIDATVLVLGFEGFEEAVLSCDFSKDDFSTNYHHSIGRKIRNEFGLWKGAGCCPVGEAPLYYWFYRRGLSHPDDMSTIILELAWCHRHQTSLDLDVEIAKYQAYWEKYWKDQWNSVNRAVERVLEKY